MKAVADASGNIVKKVDYDSFGNILNDTNPSFTVPLGFAGGLHDRDAGLVRFGYRDYDPATGRWTAKDPIFFKGGLNLFEYVQNNPINFIDPYGLLEVTVGPNIPKNPFIDPNANKVNIFPDVPGNLDITGSVKPNNFDPKQLLNDPTAELKKLLDPNNYNWKVNIEYKCKF